MLFDAKAAGGIEAALTALCHDAALRARVAAGAAATITRLGLTWRGNARRVVALAAALKGGRPLTEAALEPAELQ